MRLRPLLPALTALLALAGTACAPVEEDATDAPSTSGSTTGSTTGGATASTTSGLPADCAADQLPLTTAGTLTVGTDSPAYEPWFVDNDPTNGEGFESAVAYEVARRLGFDDDQVTWVKVPFNSSYKPGAKTFDLDINQISITPARAEVVDFSDGYYTAAQAIIALDSDPISQVTSVADLRGYSLGAQTGTTSLTVLRDEVDPEQEPKIFDDTNAAKQALLNGQVDGIVADLPTAFYITAAEIPKAKIVGQFAAVGGDPEQFGMLLEKGSALTPCVDAALASMSSDGTLDDLQQQWLSQSVDVPVLQQ